MPLNSEKVDHVADRTYREEAFALLVGDQFRSEHVLPVPIHLPFGSNAQAAKGNAKGNGKGKGKRTRDQSSTSYDAAAHYTGNNWDHGHHHEFQ
jgi:hypothetical protein